MRLLTAQLSFNLKIVETKNDIVIVKDELSNKYVVYSINEHYCFYNGDDLKKSL